MCLIIRKSTIMKNKHLFSFLFVALFLFFGCSQKSEGQFYIGNTAVDTVTLISEIETPWEVLWGPDNFIWFTERSGRVNRIDPSTGANQVILTLVDAFEYGEAGLLGMALYPDFEETPWVYLVYNYTDGPNIRERLVRYSWNGSTLENAVILIDAIPGNSYHNGSRLLFGPDGKLYMTTGDAGNTSNSQNMSSLAGKLLRLNPDGSIPSDNPDPNSYVWSSGLRNSQGLVFGSNGILYGSEHGPSSDDEVNILEKGRNYGWPDVAGFCDLPGENLFCDANNVREPLYAWTPTLAVSGIDYYSHATIPAWQGNLLMTSLKASKMLSLKLSDDGLAITETADWFAGTWGRLRDLCIAPDGRLFVAVSNRDGRGTPRPGDDRIVEIKVKNTTGMNQTDSHRKAVSIYPNPVNTEARVEWAALTGKGDYFIYSQSGGLKGRGEATGPDFVIDTTVLS
jgi:glucose/arabinose dehydrogenase